MNSSPVMASSNAIQTAAQTNVNNASGGGMDGMFMQLLITQLQNQDPLSPMDSSTFVNQLVGVNSLDQLTQINHVLQSTFGSLATANAGGH